MLAGAVVEILEQLHLFEEKKLLKMHGYSLIYASSFKLVMLELLICASVAKEGVENSRERKDQCEPSYIVRNIYAWYKLR